MRLTEKVRKLFGKGAIQILFYLEKTGEARYQEILNQHFTGSRETFSRRLLELESLGLIIREIEDSRPPKVIYKLSREGKEVVSHLRSIIDLLKTKIENDE